MQCKTRYFTHREFRLWQAFKAKYNLPYTLLSDEGNAVRKEFGVPADFFGALAGRQTYVVNRQGVITLVYNNQFQPEKHVDETLKLLQAWLYNDACCTPQQRHWSAEIYEHCTTAKLL